MEQPSRRTTALAILAVAFVGAGVFLNTLGNDFVLDDATAIVNNPAAHPPIDLHRILTTNYWGSPRDYAHLTIYRPLATLSFAVGELLHGPAPWGFHLINALLHGLVAALVALLAWLVLRRNLAALAGGLLFAVHPIHTEAVAGAVSRAEILAALFVLVTLVSYVAGRRAAGRGRLLWWSAAAFSFALGLASKENAATGLLMVVLTELALRLADRRDGRTPVGWGGVTLLSVTLVALLGGYLAWRASVLPAVLGGAVPVLDNPIVAASGAGRWLTPFVVYAKAWQLLFWPVGLSVDYTAHAIPLATSWGDLRGLVGLALFAATLVLPILWLWRRPEWALGLALFLAGYSVVSHLAFPGTIIFAERLLYLPSVGLCLLAGGLFDRLHEHLRRGVPRTLLLVVGGIVIAAGGAATVARNIEWKNELTLYATSAARTPGSSRLQTNLGRWLLDHGDPEHALQALQQAVDIAPRNFDAWANLGMATLRLGDFDAAERATRHALSMKSDHVPALNNLCVVGRAARRPETVLDACRKAVALAPRVVQVHVNLVQTLLAAGRVAEARAALDAAQAALPGAPELEALSAAMAKEGREAPSGASPREAP